MIKIKIQSSDKGYFLINDLQFQKGSLTVKYTDDGVVVANTYVKLDEISVDGAVASSVDDLRDAIGDVLFNIGGSAGGNGGVESVTGDLVSGTAENPVVNLPSDVLKDSDTSMMPSGGKVPVFSEQGLLSTGTPLFPENAVPLSYFNMMLGREGVLHLPENASESFTLSDVGILDINVDGEGAKLTFTSEIDGIKYLKLNIFNGFEISTKFFNGVLNEGEVDTELPTQGININGGYAELIYHTSMSHARVFKLTISNNGQDATWSDRSL